MNRTHIVTLIATGAFALAACSDNSATSPGTDASAGGGGAASGAGGRSAGGNGGKATGGNGGKATGGNNGTSEAGTADAATDGGDAGEAPLVGTLLAAAADFQTNVGEIVTLDLATGHLVGHANISDGDIALRVSGSRAFALERSGGFIDELSATGTVTKRIALSLGDGGPAYLNPHDVMLVSASKAYVPLNAGNAIAIIDVDAGTQTGAIGLASFLDPSDHDGSTEPDSAFYDPATHRAYFTLSRTDIFSGSQATNYMPVCPPVPALVIAIDTTSDTIVDLNGDAGGVGIALPLVAPESSTEDPASGKLFVVADGCAAGPDGGVLRTRHGIASVNLTTRATTVLYSPTSQDFLSALLPLGDSTYALEASDDNFVTTLYRFDPSAPSSLGAALVSAPDSAIVGAPGTLLGLKVGRAADGGVEQQVVRYDVATRKTRIVAEFQWQHPFFVATLAVVK
jgi:hypothetical protein